MSHIPSIQKRRRRRRNEEWIHARLDERIAILWKQVYRIREARRRRRNERWSSHRKIFLRFEHAAFKMLRHMR